MTKTVFALYDHFERAYEAVQELIKRGMNREKISVVTQDLYGQKAQQLGISNAITSAEAEPVEMGHHRENAAAASSADAFFRLLVNVRAPALPTIGPAIAAGPIAAAMSNTRTSETGSGWVEALHESGVTGEEAQTIHNGIRHGSTLVMVELMDLEGDEPVEILNRHQPADLGQPPERKSAERWQGFAEETETFAFESPDHPYKERAPGSSLDFGIGADEYLPGKAIGEYDMDPTDSSRYMGVSADEWRNYEPRFREHFERHYTGADMRWDDYRDAYRFGYDLAHLHHAMNQNWETLRGYAQQNWVSRNPGKDWNEYQDAVRMSWETARNTKTP